MVYVGVDVWCDLDVVCDFDCVDVFLLYVVG